MLGRQGRREEHQGRTREDVAAGSAGMVLKWEARPTIAPVMPALIRRATPHDLDPMLAIEQAAGTAAHWSRAQYHAIFEADALPRLALVAESGAICAFLLARTAGPEWELENLVVAPDCQRRGLGTALVEALLQHARQQHALAVLLEVRASNAAARALYQGCGFVEEGVRPRYYQNPEEDAILYRCSLADSPSTY